MPENDQHRLLGSSEDAELDDLESAHGSEAVVVTANGGVGSSSSGGKGFRDLLRLSGHHRHSFKRDGGRSRDHDHDHDHNHHHGDSHSGFDLRSGDPSADVLADSAPPEWALLLLGCLLGLATGLFVAAFNKGVCQFLIFGNKFWFFRVACYNRMNVEEVQIVKPRWVCCHA